MKILVATPIYPPEIGGPATYTKELCERLHKDHQITVVAYTDVREAFPGTTLIPVSKRRPLPIRLIKYFWAVWHASKDCDLIYVQNAMAAGLPVALASKLRGKPFILKFVGDEAWERASQHKLTNKRLEEFLEKPEGPQRIRLMMRTQGWVLRQASVVTTPSEYLGKAIQKAYKLDHKRVITNYNAADETETLPFEPKLTKHQIVATARLVNFKGIDGIIRAVAILKKKYSDVRFVCAGDGPETENLQKLIKELGVEKEVQLLGRVSRAETWQWRKNSEVYVLNSTYEGLPHTALTSFAAEIPMVATNIPGTNEAVYDDETGLLVPAGDDQALADAISKLFDNPDLEKRLVQNAKKLLQTKFSWENHLKELNGFFQSVVAKPSK
ncbi:glycosyltransferase family 4 protein [Candidatus Parcubacteria bacterium]|nr:glycosyltransferase family 4 protein [Candidatus Parcubacteria bacterium]